MSRTIQDSMREAVFLGASSAIAILRSSNQNSLFVRASPATGLLHMAAA
jgi:hypothetical protein